MTEIKKHKTILFAVGLVFIWSAIYPKEYFTWLLEVFPAIIGFGVIIYTYKSFRLTTFLYVLIAVHAIILMIGGHYTYAEMPLFNWLRDIGLFARNNYDKIGHLAQGFVPALVAREIFVRKNIINGGAWMNFIIVCVCLAVSAVYEIIEWWTSVLSGSAGDAFLGTQGYVWDTQSDMFLALAGAVAALALLSKIHDRALVKLKK